MTGKPAHGLQPARERPAAYNLPSEACVEIPFKGFTMIDALW